MFQKNVGGWDRKLRIILGVLIMLAGVYYENWWGILGLVIFLTGLFSRCGLYKFFGINTSKCNCDGGKCVCK
jgi:hypothetical protein